MNLSARTVFLTLAAAVAGLAVALGVASVTRPLAVAVPAVPERTPTGAAAAQRQAVGMAGCMAAACHGAPAERLLSGDPTGDAWPGSGSCWAAADPHTAAYSLLTDSPRRPLRVTAAEIMAKYRPGVKATDDARCLACHTNPALADLDRTPEVVALQAQGVSCEACHGNAGQWLQPHTGWTGDRTKVYADTGMRPLYDIGARALECAGCHVGAPAEGGRAVRDMNHDMIAAGHPRLDFDFAEYQRRLPRHWHEVDRTRPDSKGQLPRRTLDELQVWYVGRVAHAEAACRLLESRADRDQKGDPRTPWPEFAEFNCAACHHSLQAAHEDAKHWRKDAGYLAGRPLGSAPWQTIWPLTHAAGLDQPTRGEAELAAVVRLMEGEVPNKPPRRYAPAGEARELARATADRLKGLRDAGSRQWPDPQVVSKARGLFPKGSVAVPEWDTATQVFFGLAARDTGRSSDPGVRESYDAAVAAFRKRDWAVTVEKLEAIGRK